MSCVAAAAFVMSLLLAVGEVSTGMEVPLRVLGEVVSGPARGRPLVLHLDASLSADVRRAVGELEAVRGTPHVTLSLGHNPGWQAAATANVALSDGSSYLLHVVLWLEQHHIMLHKLCRLWQPRNLLLFTLGQSSGGATVLRHEALSGVERLALIESLSGGDDALGVYASLPFSHGGVQLLGPWRPEIFTDWEVLFPYRFPSFEGYTFHLATFFKDPPFLYSTAAAPERGRGMATWILDAMAAKLNFSYTLTKQSPDLKWGIIENDSWVGVLGMIARKDKNFSVNFYLSTEERMNDFDFSEYVWEGLNAVFLLSPRPLPKWLSLVRPFNLATWVSLTLAVALAMVFMAALVSSVVTPGQCVLRGTLGLVS